MDREVKKEKMQDTVRDEIKIGGTVYVVNQIFTEKQSKQDAWLALITRAESLKAGR